jgi:phage terminase small subunit
VIYARGMGAADHLPGPPKGLRPAQRRLWREIVAAFELETHHLRILASACFELDRAEAAEETIATEGEYLTNARSHAVKPHPAGQVARSARLAAARLLRELGLEDDVQVDVRRLSRSRGYGRNNRR